MLELDQAHVGESSNGKEDSSWSSSQETKNAWRRTLVKEMGSYRWLGLGQKWDESSRLCGMARFCQCSLRNWKQRRTFAVFSVIIIIMSLFDMLNIGWCPCDRCRLCGRGTPLPYRPFTSSSFPPLLFSFFHWLYLFSSFVHPFPLYQNSPTPFPGWRS